MKILYVCIYIRKGWYIRNNEYLYFIYQIDGSVYKILQNNNEE